MIFCLVTVSDSEQAARQHGGPVTGRIGQHAGQLDARDPIKVFETRRSAASRSLAGGAAPIGARFRASIASLKSGLRPKPWLTHSE